jgi:hypothetical protein
LEPGVYSRQENFHPKKRIRKNQQTRNLDYEIRISLGMEKKK